MATARELLQLELQRRAEQSQTDDSSMREAIAQQQTRAEIDPAFRRPMKMQTAFIDELTGSNLAQHVKDPTSTEQALRQAFQAKQATPKQNLLGYLQSQIGAEKADADAIAKQQAAAIKAGKTKEMSGEARKRMGSTRMALDALDDMETAIGKGSSILPEFVTGPTGDNMLTEARRRFVEGFGRGQSGAAISDEERANFARMAPRFSDSPEIQNLKFNRMRNELQLRMQELQGGEYTRQDMSAPKTGYDDQGGFDMSKMTEEELNQIIGGK